MNTQKYRIGNCGLFREADRSMYDKKDTVSKSIIHKERTHLNYNLCPHEQYTMQEIKSINRKIRGKELAKNAIAWGGTVVSLPKDYTGDTKAFFRTAYEGLKKIYKLKDEDIISAYVHMDETTPHMHFYFIPIKHGEKDCVNWNKVMPKSMYDTQHQRLQRYMTEKLHTPVNILNGDTKGTNLSKLTAKEKQVSMRIEKLQKWAEETKQEVGNLRKQKATLEEEIKTAGDRLLTGIDGMVRAHDGLRRTLNVSWRLSEDTKDKITEAMDKTDVRAEKALKQPLDSVDAIMAAADAAERAQRAYSKLKAAAKGDMDVDKLLDDDDFER